MKKIVLSIIVITLLGLSACKVGPNYQRPEVNVPEYFRYDSLRNDSAYNLSWFDLFQDEELQNLIRIGLEENKDLLVAASRIEEARAVVGYNKSDQFPSVSYQISAERSNLSGAGAITPYNQFFGAPGISWEIDFWGKYRRSTEAARAELLATEYGYRNVIVSLASEITTAYFQMLDYRMRLKIAKSTLDSRKKSLNIIQERFNKGYTAELDLNQAQIQESVAAAAIPRYERSIAQTEHALSILLGRNPGPIKGNALIDQVVPPDIPPGLPSVLLERRPDILQAEGYLAAQTAQIGVAQALRFPSISLTALLGVASADLTGITWGNNGIWSVSGGILGPVFEFGKNKRRVEIERERTEQALLQYENTILQSFREVEDALIEIYTYKMELEAIEAQLAASRNAAYLSNKRYDGGVTSYLEVLDSERTLFDAEVSASQTRQLQLQAYVKLYKALGGGW